VNKARRLTANPDGNSREPPARLPVRGPAIRSPWRGFSSLKLRAAGPSAMLTVKERNHHLFRRLLGPLLGDLVDGTDKASARGCRVPHLGGRLSGEGDLLLQFGGSSPNAPIVRLRGSSVSSPAPSPALY
jgi:hypothetical protein